MKMEKRRRGGQKVNRKKDYGSKELKKNEKGKIR